MKINLLYPVKPPKTQFPPVKIQFQPVKNGSQPVGIGLPPVLLEIRAIESKSWEVMEKITAVKSQAVGIKTPSLAI